MYSNTGAISSASVGNLLTGNDEETQLVISLGILPQFAALLHHPKNTIRKWLGQFQISLLGQR